jgi:6-phosphogluconolactonase
MNNFEVLTFPNTAALAKAAAKRWGEAIAAHNSPSPYCVALSGGRVTRDFFSGIVEEAKEHPLRLDQVHFFWSDERCVPPTDPESNFSVAQQHLLSPLSIPSGQIHRIRGELKGETAVAEAEADVRRLCPPGEHHQPIFDLILLGMGEDGHVASLFPSEPDEMMVVNGIFRQVRAGKPPPDRITMNYLTIAAARRVWVLASGAGKVHALRESLLPAGKTPLSRVLNMRKNTMIFTDIAGSPA